MPLLIFVVSFQARMSFAGDTPASQPGPATFFGEVGPMGNGMVWSWVRRDAKNTPTALGITFTETALFGLPENLPANGLHG